MALGYFEKERIAMYVVTVFTVLGILIGFVAGFTDYWMILTIPDSTYRNATRAWVTGYHSGLWRICRFEVINSTVPEIHREYCQIMKFFPTQDEIDQNDEIDSTIVNYSRTETAFAVIALLLMLIGHVFVFYSLREPRYMFKRLTALLHFMTAASVLVSAEVMVRSVKYERRNLPDRHPKGAYISYGYSFVLAWIVFAIYVIAAIVFLFFSRKRKGDKAADEREAMENEPVHLGRI